MRKRKSMVFGMALALLLTASPMVSEAAEPVGGVPISETAGRCQRLEQFLHSGQYSGTGLHGPWGRMLCGSGEK